MGIVTYPKHLVIPEGSLFSVRLNGPQWSAVWVPSIIDGKWKQKSCLLLKPVKCFRCVRCRGLAVCDSVSCDSVCCVVVSLVRTTFLPDGRYWLLQSAVLLFVLIYFLLYVYECFVCMCIFVPHIWPPENSIGHWLIRAGVTMALSSHVGHIFPGIISGAWGPPDQCSNAM